MTILRYRILLGLVMAFVLGNPVLPVSRVDAQEATPLRLPQAQELYQRVLTLPGASLVAGPDGNGGTALPVFSIFYVYGKQGEWLQVGRDLRRGPEGWVRASLAQNWSVMLTMQYAPPGQRERVLFFERQQDLRDVVTAVDPVPLVHKLTAAIDGGQATDPPLASVEPSDVRGAQQPNGSFYVMPITGFSTGRFDGDQPATLLNVSLVNANPQPPSPPPAPIVQNMHGAIVFVLDTTMSMKPYFQRAVQSIRTVLTQLKANGLDQKVAVGVVAYRNNIDNEPQKSGLGYVAKIIQPLNPKASVEEIMAAVDTLDEARVSSHSFNEDAVAGLWTAITQLDWAAFENQPKLLFLVTDAGALSGDDPKAKFKGIDILNVAEAASRQGVQIATFHIASAGAKKFNNIEPTRRQYSILSRTGDDNSDRKYKLIDPATPAHFDAIMAGFEKATASTIVTWSKKSSLERPKFDAKDDEGEEYRKIIINELFNAQQRYVGVNSKTQSKTVFNAWAADRDLTNPNRTALHVSVYLTRNQLNQLAISARRIYDTAKSQEISSDTMFRLLQNLSGQTAQDPERFKGDAAKVANMGLLPSFLTLLPYKSEFLDMTPKDWGQKTADAQATMLARLSYKIRAYQDMYADDKKWVDLGSGDSGQRVMPVPLEYLP